MQKRREASEREVAILTAPSAQAGRLGLAPFHDRLERLVARGTTRIVVDLSKARWIGAATLGELIQWQVRVRQAGGDLRLAGPSGKIDRALEATALSNKVFRKICSLHPARSGLANQR